MKRCMLLISSLVLAGSAVAADFSKVPSGTYEVDPVHAYVNFQYNHQKSGTNTSLVKSGLTQPIIRP